MIWIPSVLTVFSNPRVRFSSLGQLYCSRKRLIRNNPTRGWFITLNNLYNEIGWLSLADRRTYQKLVYTLRNALVRDIIARRTDIFANSFIQSSVKLWNDLPPEVKSLQFLSLFKHLNRWMLVRHEFKTIKKASCCFLDQV